MERIKYFIFRFNNEIPTGLLSSSKEYLENHEKEVGLYIEIPFLIENPNNVYISGTFNNEEKLTFAKVALNLFRCNEFHWELNSIDEQKENSYSIEVKIDGNTIQLKGDFKTDHFLSYA